MGIDRKILIAVEDSEVSAYAFTWAQHNLLRTSDHVIVLTASRYGVYEYPASGVSSITGVFPACMLDEYGVPLAPSVKETQLTEKSVNGAPKALVQKYCQLCAQHGISCEGEVVKGEAGSWIVHEANRVGADVIVVGSHAYGVIKRAFLGSKSDYVLRNAPCPVAIVRQAEDTLQLHDPLSSSGLTRKIVIAVDLSDEAVYAFTWALEHFCKEDDKVIIYHVHQSVMVTSIGTGQFGTEGMYIPSVDYTPQEEVKGLSDSEKLVESFMAYASKKSKIKCEGMVVTGQTEAKVCEGLVALNADTLVIGMHDRSSLSRTFLGSVSEYLVHNSPCPLIVAKMPKSGDAEPEVEAHRHDQ